MKTNKAATACLSLRTWCWKHGRDALFSVDNASGLIVDANPRAEELMGIPRDVLVGMQQERLFPAAQAGHILSVLQQSNSVINEQIVHTSGASIPVEISSSGSIMHEGRATTVLVIRDVSGVLLSAHRLAAQEWALSAYSSAAIALGMADTDEGLMQAVCAAITHESIYVLAWIGIAEDEPGQPVRVAAFAGAASAYLQGLHVSWSADSPSGQGPTGNCIRSGLRQVVQDVAVLPSFAPWRDRALSQGICSSVSVPFVVSGNRRAALMVYAGKTHAFEDSAIEVFERLAQEVSHGLCAMELELRFKAERSQREEAQAALADSLAATVRAMSKTLEKRDPYTAGHEDRVAQIAYAIGAELGWSEQRLTGLQWAAQMHDIGKISVPIEILTKPTRLTPTERAFINEHPETGYAILKDIPFPWPIADIVRQHHERMDGSGYPLGLSGADILEEARLLAIADIVESMGSYRPYRAALGIDAALLEIASQAGRQLDRKMVDACLFLFRENKFILPKVTGLYYSA